MVTRIHLCIGSLLLFLSLPAVAVAASLTQDSSSAIIYAYYKIGEDSYPALTLSKEDFKAHIREIETNNYAVLPLKTIISALKANTPLPDNTMAITFEGGHSSIMDDAVPLLLEKKIPFTIFISPTHVDHNAAAYIGWPRLKKLQKKPLVTIGLHPDLYNRYASEEKEAIRRHLNKAKVRYREEFDEDPVFFAYPYGEYSQAYKELMNEQGFMAAFSQQSSVTYAGNDLYALPRFTMTGLYGDTNRFRLTANLKPLPASDIVPIGQQLEDNPPTVGFTLPDTLSDKLSSLRCFSSEDETPQLEIIGKNRVQLQFFQRIEDNRVRINCTLPDGETEDGDPRFRWYGMIFTIPDELL